MFTSCWYLVALCHVAFAVRQQGQIVLDQDKNHVADHVRHKLKSADIIPDVIPDFKPEYKLNVEWSTDHSASLGNTLKPKHLQDAPSLELVASASDSSVWACMSNITHVIALTDPDAPSRDNPKWSEFCHWIASGLTVSDATLPGEEQHQGCSTLILANLEEVVPYKPPSPPPKTGPHRYVFFVFVPENRTTEKLHLTKPDDRQHWGYEKAGHGVRDWAEKNELIPVAANFIYSKNKEQ